MGWITVLLASEPARKTLGLLLAALTIALFLLNSRRTGNAPGGWLSACAVAGSEARAPCPPVVEYTAADQARAADEVDELPEGAMVVRMLSDYAVLRDQAQACR